MGQLPLSVLERQLFFRGGGKFPTLCFQSLII